MNKFSRAEFEGCIVPAPLWDLKFYTVVPVARLDRQREATGSAVNLGRASVRFVNE